MKELESHYYLSKHAAGGIKCLPHYLRDNLATKLQYLRLDPRHPSLDSHELGGLKVDGEYEFYLSDGYRVVYDWKDGIHIWDVGNHVVVDRARDLTFAGGTKFQRVAFDASDRVEQQPVEQQPEIPEVVYPYVGITPAHLRILGVPSELVNTVRWCPSFQNLCNLPGLAPEVAASIRDLALREEDDGGLFNQDNLVYRDSASRLEDFCHGSIKQLMLNLNPEQEDLATRELSSSILVRGCAGSGKTSVALQRAANLFVSDKRVLYVTYTTVLADFANSLLREIAGGSLPRDKIMIETTNQLARGILSGRGLWRGDGNGVQENKYRLLDYMTWACDDMAHNDDSPVLKEPSFVLDEVHEVIKGMSVVSEDEYLGIPRHGRGRPLSEDARRAVWKAYTKYQEIMTRYKVVEWADMPMLALRELQERPYDRLPYDEVIVDEAQDLSMTDIRLCTMLAPVLFVVGDVAQSIYSRGYSWRDAGLELRGHSYSLKHDYRNTKEIAVTGQSLLDSESDLVTSDDLVPVESAKRHGPWPIILQTPTTELEVDAVCTKILALTEHGELRPGDCAILCPTNKQCDTVFYRLFQNGVPAWIRQRVSTSVSQAADPAQGRLGLDVFDDTVKVLTYQSAKGLEFPVVFVLSCDEGVLPYVPRSSDPEADAELRRQRRVLYVSMTRAIEALYLVTSQEHSSRFLSELPREMVTLEVVSS